MEILWLILKITGLVVVAGTFALLGVWLWKKAESGYIFWCNNMLPFLSIVAWILCVVSMVAIPAVFYITIGKAVIGALQ
jgi:cytochrome b subunit of formate dehydrogenase